MSSRSDDYHQLAGGLAERDRADIACPYCGPFRSTPRKQREAKLRVWRLGKGAVSFCCARCGEKGVAVDDEYRKRLPVFAEARRSQRKEQAGLEREAVTASRAKALVKWQRSLPICGTLAEIYLREARRITCPLPATLRFLPAWKDFPPAMIAVFGMATEPEPGVLAIDENAIRGVHLTRLTPDGRKLDEGAKRFLGLGSTGSPIVLAPPNDMLGLVIAEGIEDALSAYQATGLGAWAAGSARRLPALADAVPDWMDCVSVVLDADDAGRRNAPELVAQLQARGIFAELVEET